MSFFHNNALAGASGQTTGGDDAYQIEKSLRFNDDDSPSLERYISTSGNRSTWTWSGWVKKSNISSSSNLITQGIFYCGTDSNNREGLLLLNDNTLAVAWRSSGTTDEQLTLAPLFRDPSAWFHIVWSFDNNVSGTSPTGKSKIYINGKLIKDYGSGADAFSATIARKMNESGNTFYIGKNPANQYADALLADVQFIDGLALSPAAFGSFDSTGVWNPKAFALPAPNDGTTWSGQVSGNWYSTYNATKAFDGDIASWSIPADGQNVTWTPTSTINATSIRVKIEKNGSGGPLKQNGNDITNLVATGWVELPERTLSELIWGSSGSGSQVRISAIEIDGVILVDGQTDPTTRNNPNNGTTWSDSLTGTIDSNHPAVDAFDGDLSDYQGVPNNGSETTVTFTHTFTNVKSLRVHADMGNVTPPNSTIHNGGSSQTFTLAVGKQWHDLTAKVAALGDGFTSIVFKKPSNNYIDLYAIEVNGHILVDSTVDNSFHLKFNDTALNRYLGKDTLNGKIADATGGLPIYNTTDDYGDVKGAVSGEVYREDSSAGTTDGTGLVLAVPGDSVETATCDVHQNINTGSSNVAIYDSSDRPVVSTDESRLYGSSLYFDGVDNRLRFASEAFGTGTFTVECWVKIDPTQTGSYHNTVGNLMGTPAGYWSLTTRKNNSNTVSFAFSNGSSVTYIESGKDVHDNQWHHLAAVREGTGSNQMKLYVDGTLVKEHDCAQDLTQTSYWRIMKNDQSGEVTGTKGYIQDVRIYKGVTKYTANFKPPTRNDFTVNNINHDAGGVSIDNGDVLPFYQTTGSQGGTKNSPTAYNTDSNSSNLVLALPGDVLTDEHDNVNTGSSAKTVTASGVVTSTDQSRFYGTSVKFVDDGSNDVLSIANNEDLCDFGSGNFTMEAWVYPTKNQDSMCIMGCSRNSSSPNRRGPMLFTNIDSYNTVRFEYSTGGSHAVWIMDGTANSSAAGGAAKGKWTHVAVVRSGNDCKLYINGTQSGSTLDVSSISTAADNDDDPFTVGNNSDGTWGAFDGYMQDVRVYKGAAKYTSNFTPPSLGEATNIDSLVDTPTNYGEDTGAGGEVRGNYCTWNPLDATGTYTLDQGNLGGTGNNFGARGTIAPSTGKWYYETTITAIGQGGDYGIVDANKNVHSGDPGSVAHGWSVHTAGGKRTNGTNTGGYIAAYATGDVVNIAWDIDAGKVWFGKNGTWGSSGNPATGANAAFTNVSGKPAPAIGNGGSNGFEFDSNFGQRAFKYTAPSGFKALCTQNLPDTFSGDELNNPSKYFDILNYTGTAAVQTIKGLNFQPDLIWIKNRGDSSTSHSIYDAARGQGSNGYYRIESDTLDAQADGSNLTAITSDGFTLTSAGNYTNSSGAHFIAWCWDAGTSGQANTNGSLNIASGDQWANPTAGFSMTKYTGPASGDFTIGHGLNDQPQFLIIKQLDSDGGWIAGHVGITLGTGRLVFNDNVASTDGYSDIYWQDTAPTNTLITIGDNSNVYDSGGSFICYAWAAIPGYSAFGHYESNGNDDGPFIYTGFKPALVIIKAIDDISENWYMLSNGLGEDYNEERTFLVANNTNAESTYVGLKHDMVSNGIKIRENSSETNHTTAGTQYIYAAFAEHPFKTSRAR